MRCIVCAQIPAPCYSSSCSNTYSRTAETKQSRTMLYVQRRFSRCMTRKNLTLNVAVFAYSSPASGRTYYMCQKRNCVHTSVRPFTNKGRVVGLAYACLFHFQRGNTPRRLYNGLNDTNFYRYEKKSREQLSSRHEASLSHCH